MCSFLGQIAYGALMFICLGLTLGSLFSPGWYSDGNDTHTGIVTCGKNPDLSDQQNKDLCNKWWDAQPTSVKAVVYLMGAAVLIEIFALFWTLASFCACCCRSHFLHVLPTAATITAVLLIIAMILFGAKHDIKDLPEKDSNFKKLDSISYSFWLGIGAILVAIAASIMGSITSCLSDKCC
uniref:Uncharacterized protein n=1 Tax=Panagrolaimus sp. PS1159 TaxID=55785 RepID=A0AC35GM08_9BILA